MPPSTYYAVLLALVLGAGCSATPTMRIVAGTYEGIVEGDAIGLVFLENGVFKEHHNGKKHDKEARWKLLGKEVHIVGNGVDVVFNINRDGSLTEIAYIYYGPDGKPKLEVEQRKNILEKDRTTYKKVK